MNVEKQDSNELELTLDGVLSSNKFLKAIKAFFAILDNVTDSVTETRGAIEWQVEVREGSAVLMVQAIPKKVPLGKTYSVTQAIKAGFHLLESGEKERPPFFNDAAMKGVKDLGVLTGEDILVKVEGEQLSTQVVASVDAILKARYIDHGTIEGTLETISGHNGYEFTIYDDLTNNGVRCYFKPSEDTFQKVLNAFSFERKSRMSVWGDISYRKDGTAISIKVDGFRVFKPQNELPQIESIVGLFGNAS